MEGPRAHEREDGPWSRSSGVRGGRGMRQGSSEAMVEDLELQGLDNEITHMLRERDENERHRIYFESELQNVERAIARKRGVSDTQDQMHHEYLIGNLLVTAKASQHYADALQNLFRRWNELSTRLAGPKREFEESQYLYPPPHQQQTMAGISPSTGNLTAPAGEDLRSRRMEYGQDNMPHPPTPGQPYDLQPGGLPYPYANASYMPSNVYDTTTDRPQSHLEYPEPYGQNTGPYRWVTSQHGGGRGTRRVVYEPSRPPPSQNRGHPPEPAAKDVDERITRLLESMKLARAPPRNNHDGQPPKSTTKEEHEQIARLSERLRRAREDMRAGRSNLVTPPRYNNHGHPSESTTKERNERRARFLERSNSDRESRTTDGSSQFTLSDGTRISVGGTVRVMGPDGRTQTFANEGDPSGMHIDISEDGSVTVRSPKPSPDQGRPRESSKRVSFAVDKATGSTLMPPARVQHRHSSNGLSSQYGQHPQSASAREPVSLSIRPSMHRRSVLDLARQSEPNLNNDNTVRARRGADPLSISMPPLSAVDLPPPRPGFSNGMASPAISESSTTSGQSVAIALDLRGRSLPRSQFYHFQDGGDKESEKRSTEWLYKVRHFRQVMMSSIPKKLQKTGIAPVRITVIDTGIDGGHPFLAGIKDPQTGRVRKCRWDMSSGPVPLFKDFADTNAAACSTEPVDFDGHGTFIAGLMLYLLPNVELSVARIGKNAASIQHDPDLPNKVAKAIRYALDTWNPEIITMSFSCPETPSTLSAVQTALGRNVTLLAAAGNDGYNGVPKFPATVPGVFKIYPVTAEGKDFSATPLHDPQGRESSLFQFHTLGRAIPAIWSTACPERLRPDSYRVDDKMGPMAVMAGSSFAVPIAAVLVATVILMDNCRRIRVPRGASIRTAEGVQLILASMSRLIEPAGYRYLSPPTTEEIMSCHMAAGISDLENEERFRGYMESRLRTLGMLPLV